MKTLDSFTKKIKPNRRKSKLVKFEKEIHKLYQSGYRVEQIQNFLNKNGIQVSSSYIWRFLKLNKNLNIKSFSLQTPTSEEVVLKSVEELQTESKSMKAFLDDADKTVASIQKNKEKE